VTVLSFLDQIQFDDGDTCDNILPEHVFSEADYKRIEGKDPPAPSSDSHNHPLSGFGFCRKWIGKSTHFACLKSRISCSIT
jgi:hypothetical protein